MKETLELELETTVEQLFGVKTKIELTRPNNQFGDYSTSVALKLADSLKRSTDQIAEAIKAAHKSQLVKDLTITKPGFINLVLTDEAVSEAAEDATKSLSINQKKEILVEFGDPNLFKLMHLGHLYSSILGDSIATTLSANGATVKRLSYGSDVGLNVAKWVWMVGESIDWQIDGLNAALAKEADPLGKFYAEGNKAYESDPKKATEIKVINKKIYEADDKTISEIYRAGRELSIKTHEKTFQQVGVKYDKNYYESEISEIGAVMVRKHQKTVFEESDKAIIYRGEKQGLHTRVFINSQGLPTYEAKDLGLAELKKQDFPKTALSIVITASEQVEYFKVMLAALSEIDPDLAKSTVHLNHGFLSLSSGKMSSRTGNVYTANQLLDEVRDLVNKRYPDSPVKDEVYLAAIKYSFLKQRRGSDIVFNLEESIGLEGNSGPYIQYAHARACSILAKARTGATATKTADFQAEERELAFKISEYPEVVQKSIQEYLPSHICKYMFELAQLFNSFYEHNRVLEHPRSIIRIKLVEDYAEVLKAGLALLNISAPVKM